MHDGPKPRLEVKPRVQLASHASNADYVRLWDLTSSARAAAEATPAGASNVMPGSRECVPPAHHPPTRLNDEYLTLFQGNPYYRLYMNVNAGEAPPGHNRLSFHPGLVLSVGICDLNEQNQAPLRCWLHDRLAQK